MSLSSKTKTEILGYIRVLESQLVIASQHADEAIGIFRRIDEMWSEDFHGPEDWRAIGHFTDRTIAIWRDIRSALGTGANVERPEGQPADPEAKE